MIPAQAVEAAARAIHEAGDWDVSWVGDDWRAECARAEARAALEAAAPHMLASVWEEGAQDASLHWGAPEVGTAELLEENPYRPNA